MEHNKTFILKKLSSGQKGFIVLGFCAFIGLCISLFPSFVNKDNIEKNKSATLTDSEYVSFLENRLSSTISAIKGAGKAQAFITLESSYETVYMSNAKLDETIDASQISSTTSEKVLATMKNGTYSEEPVVVKQICPKISGVLIVCEGGENSNVKKDIINAASTALNISSSRIYVTGGIVST